MTAQAIDDRIIERIRKTLNLAANNPSEEEAHAAMLKAQEMLAKYSLEMEAVMGADETEKEVVDEMAAPTRTWWIDSLSNAVAPNFRCTPYIVRRRGVFFIGLKDDVEIAKTVFDFAIKSVRAGWSRYRAAHRITGRAAGVMNDYIRGYLKGLRDKFAEQVDRENWGLVLVQDQAVIDAVDAKRLGRAQPSSIRTDRNEAAHSQGYRDGKAFSGPRPPTKKIAHGGSAL